MNYATGHLTAFFILGAAILVGCQTTATTETKPTVTQTPSTERSVEYALADERRVAPAHADPFTGTCKGSWLDERKWKRWRIPAKVRFLSSTPDSVSIVYYQDRGLGILRNADSIKLIRNGLPRKGNSFSRPLSKGDTVIFTAEENGSIKMERRAQSGRVKGTGRLWCEPEQHPDVPAQLAALEGLWSGSARSDTYWRFGFDVTMEVDLFWEGPHVVATFIFQLSNVRLEDGSAWPDERLHFVKHLAPTDPPDMYLTERWNVTLRDDGTVSLEYKLGRRHPHYVRVVFQKKESRSAL